VKTLTLLLILTASLVQAEEATHYAGRFTGRPMANTKPYDPTAFTCAYESIHEQPFKYPLGTIILVTYKNTSIAVELTDRHDGKTDIDLSFEAFLALLGDADWVDQGRLKGVKIEIIPLSTKASASSQPSE